MCLSENAITIVNELHAKGMLFYNSEYSPLIDALQKLEEYEEDEAAGMLVRVPCRVGDTVYDKDGDPFQVKSIEWFSRKVTHLHCVAPATGRSQTFAIGKRSIGKTVFLEKPQSN